MKKLLASTSAMSMVILLSGCSLFTKNVEKVPTLPSDRETIAVKTTVKNYTSAELNEGIVKGDWMIDSVGNVKAAGQTPPFLKFVPTDKKVYGNNGCNSITATYKYNPADSTLSFDNLAATMMLCPETDITDAEISAALGKTARYTWRIDGSDYFLTFYTEEGEKLMTLLHQNFEFLNGVWRVTEIDGQKTNDPNLRLVIDVDEGKIHGDTGCNILNGKLDIDMELPNSISFHSIMVTRMACAEPNYETVFLVALEEATAARPASEKEVLLLNGEGKIVMKLIRDMSN